MTCTAPFTSILSIIRSHWMLSILLLATIWLRMPLLSAGLPYFTHEDEAHHFNRTMEMVKSGDLDPHYFHKPSLHFYLRLPFVAAAALRERRSGAIESVKEVRTRDQYGVGGYSFSASHPSIVKAARACSLLLGLGVIGVTYWLALLLSGCRWGALIAAGVASFAPEAFRYSTTIGVDIVMTFFSVSAVLVAVAAFRNFSLGNLFLCAVLAGLAVSSKYNALPIFLVPITLWLLAGSWRWGEILAAFVVPWAAFLLASPYIILSLPLFIDHLGYELWHYGVAGHEGHTAEPGLAQLMFYLSWIASDGGGLFALILSLIGGAFLAHRRSGENITALIFPLCFLALMVGQRANFTRNMVVLIPFLGVLAGCGAHFLLSRLFLAPLRLKIVPVAAVCIMAQPLFLLMRERGQILQAPESRVQLSEWIRSQAPPTTEWAISGQLQPSSELRTLPGVSIVNEHGLSARELFLNGVSFVATNARFTPPPGEEEIWKKIHDFDGIAARQRIVVNPGISIFHLVPSETYLTSLQSWVRSSAPLSVTANLLQSSPDAFLLRAVCDGDDQSEPHCWVKTTLASLVLSIPDSARPSATRNDKIQITIPVLSPWRPQTIRIITPHESPSCDLPDTDRGAVHHCTFSVSPQSLTRSEPLLISVSTLGSPLSRGINKDSRRLGVALLK